MKYCRTIFLPKIALVSNTFKQLFSIFQNIIWGFSLSLLLLTYIGLTVISLGNTVKQITTYSVISFRGSDFTNANFKNAKLGLSDFTNAIGVELRFRS